MISSWALGLVSACNSPLDHADLDRADGLFDAEIEDGVRLRSDAAIRYGQAEHSQTDEEGARCNHRPTPHVGTEQLAIDNGGEHDRHLGL